MKCLIHINLMGEILIMVLTVIGSQVMMVMVMILYSDGNGHCGFRMMRL